MKQLGNIKRSTLGSALRLGTLSLLLAAGSVACSVEKTEDGEFPEVDVDVSGGELPEYDVDAADIDVGTKDVEVSVPDVDVSMEKRTVEVPDIDIDMPEDDVDPDADGSETD